MYWSISVDNAADKIDIFSYLVQNLSGSQELTHPLVHKGALILIFSDKVEMYICSITREEGVYVKTNLECVIVYQW